MKNARNTLLIIMAVLCPLLFYGQGGNLDPVFGTGGKLIGPFLNGSEWGRATAVQSDGKIVVAGFGEEAEHYVCLARYLSSGSLDNTFGKDGKVIVPFPNSSLEIHDVLVQPDGKIVVAGWINQSATISDDNFLLMRFLSNGDPDTGFGINGIQITDFAGHSDRANAMFLRLDGKLVVAGQANNGGKDMFALARYLTDGTLDASFEADGMVMTDLGGTNCRIFDIASQSDAKIVVAGYTVSGGETSAVVARYFPSGYLDFNFSNDGILTVDFGPGDEEANAVVVQPDGKIVLGVTTNLGGLSDFALCRIEPEGFLDYSFDGDGIQTTDFGANDVAAAMKIQPDGNLVLAGWSGNNLAVARYLPNGAPDNTFSYDGKLTYDISDADQIFGLALQSDGKIVAAGSVWDEYQAYFLTMRFLTNGVLDNGFSEDGYVLTAFVASRDIARAVVVQSDNKILAAGASWDGNDWDFALARCLYDGTPDYSFGTEGMVTTDFGGESDEIFGAVQQPDGKIVVAGAIGDDFAVARYLANGSLDGAFGNGGYLYWNPSDVYNATANALGIQSDGKLVIVGEAVTNLENERDFTIIRLTTSGLPDLSFGNLGIVTNNFGPGYTDVPTAVAIQSDGKIVVAGYSAHYPDIDLAVARYLSTGEPDPAFGSGGTLLVSGIGLLDYVRALAVQSDGKILLAGESYLSPTELDAILVRLNEDGNFDQAFGVNGVVRTDLTSTVNNAFAMVVQTDGKILTAGYNAFFNNNDFVLQRYLADGSLDSSFGGMGYVLTDFTGSTDVAYALALQPDGKIVAAGETLTYGTDYDFAIARYLPGMLIQTNNPSNNFVPVSVYPNPMIEQVTVAFTLKDQDVVTISLLNAEGRRVQVFAEQVTMQEGDHQLVVRPDAGLPAGWYTLLVVGREGQTAVKVSR